MEPDVMLRIDSIEDITDRGICAILAGGKRIWIPERFCTPIPGALVVPGWLIRKIRRTTGKAERGTRKREGGSEPGKRRSHTEAQRTERAGG